ncbi:MAG: hypothetical protein CM15mV34_0410 [Caudoviricetes sp.]|nr:MAG: hypothetical protein CM15mV34_0410 [Caudoviricetes sp.]
MINRQLLEKGYMIVNGFVNPEYCHELYQDLLKDGRTENTFSVMTFMVSSQPPQPSCSS